MRLSLLAALLMVGSGITAAQSLVDLAKKTTEERSGSKGSPKVYTNNDLPSRKRDNGNPGLEPAARVANPEAIPPGRWTISRDTSPMDSSATVALSLKANAPVKAWLKAVQPALILRCKERTLDTYLVTDTAAAVEYGGSHTVRVRFNEAAPVSENWGQSTDHKALFAPEPEVFLGRLRATDRLLIEFTPFNASPATVAFDSRGVEHYINQLIDACPATTSIRRR